MKNAWEPNPKQLQALVRLEDEVLYGGARGGGKTEAGMGFIVYPYKHPKYRGLVLRRNADDLKDWIDRARSFFARVGGQFKGSPPYCVFPSGAIIRTGHLKEPGSYSKYQGHEYQKMLWEEITHIPSEENYLKVLASNRSTIPELTAQSFATTNPDGPGHTWVKRRWNLPDSVPGATITGVDKQTKHSLCFIPARVEDCPQLFNNDPGYVRFLEGLPDGLREQWREGSWEEFDIKGAIYQNEYRQAAREERIQTLAHLQKLRVHTVWDLGIGDSMAIGFWQRTEGHHMRLIHAYQNEGYGLPHYIAYLQEMREKNKWIYGKHFAPHDAKKRELSSGLTFQQAAEPLGITFEIVPMLDVMPGISAARMMWPRVWINKSQCQQFIDAIKQYRKKWDDDKGIFLDDPVHDWTSHYADMFRYTAVIEEEMMIPDGAKEFKEPAPQPVSEYQAPFDAEDIEYDDHGNPKRRKHPLLKGVDIGKL